MGPTRKNLRLNERARPLASDRGGGGGGGGGGRLVVVSMISCRHNPTRTLVAHFKKFPSAAAAAAAAAAWTMIST